MANHAALKQTNKQTNKPTKSVVHTNNSVIPVHLTHCKHGTLGGTGKKAIQNHIREQTASI